MNRHWNTPTEADYEKACAEAVCYGALNAGRLV